MTTAVRITVPPSPYTVVLTVFPDRIEREIQGLPEGDAPDDMPFVVSEAVEVDE